MHKDRKSCAKHKDIVIKEMKNLDNNTSTSVNSNVIQKLTFDMAMIEASKKESIDTVAKSIVKYLNDRVTKRLDNARRVANVAAVIPAMTVSANYIHIEASLRFDTKNTYIKRINIYNIGSIEYNTSTCKMGNSANVKHCVT